MHGRYIIIIHPSTVLIQMVEWNGILESKIYTRYDLGFHVLYCMGIKSVIASNNCTNADADMHQYAVKGAALC